MLVGMGIPALALLGGIVVLSGSGARVLGWPVLCLWVFLCFPLTTLCLGVRSPAFVSVLKDALMVLGVAAVGIAAGLAALRDRAAELTREAVLTRGAQGM